MKENAFKNQDTKKLVKISFAVTEDQQKRLDKIREQKIFKLSAMFRDALNTAMDEYEELQSKIKTR